MSKSKKVYVNPWGGVIDGKYSLSAIAFMRELEMLEYLILYILAADRVFTTRYEELREDTLEYIKSLNPRFEENFNHILKNQADILILRSRTYEGLLSQMVYNRSIENFLLYLKNILAEVIQVKPQLLKSGETERLDFILDFDVIKSANISRANRG